MIWDDVLSLFKPPFRGEVEDLSFEGNRGQLSIKGGLSIGGDHDDERVGYVDVSDLALMLGGVGEGAGVEVGAGEGLRPLAVDARKVGLRASVNEGEAGHDGVRQCQRCDDLNPDVRDG